MLKKLKSKPETVRGYVTKSLNLTKDLKIEIHHAKGEGIKDPIEIVFSSNDGKTYNVFPVTEAQLDKLADFIYEALTVIETVKGLE